MKTNPKAAVPGAALTALCAVSLILSACAGAVPWNPQGYSGINKGVIEFGPDGKPKRAEIIGGKEQTRLVLDADMQSGKFHYEAVGVRAFDGQKVRAAVEQAVSADVRAVAPGIVDSVMSAVMRALGVPK